MSAHFRVLYGLIKTIATDPRWLPRFAVTTAPACSSARFTRDYRETLHPDPGVALPAPSNPLWDYFQNHTEGHGIWKWEHYFEIYHRHFARFIGRRVSVLEVGIYSGGSLSMWRSYFGEHCHVHGVDIEGACKAYENDHITVHIGDQADRTFWTAFKQQVDAIDIVIDDGGHAPEQQQVTLEEMLPYLRPGGVYLCEDVHGTFNRFGAYATGLVNELNRVNRTPGEVLQTHVAGFQSSVHSIHFYPYVVVIEKHHVPTATLVAPKHGTHWQPFFS